MCVGKTKEGGYMYLSIRLLELYYDKNTTESLSKSHGCMGVFMIEICLTSLINIYPINVSEQQIKSNLNDHHCPMM